MPKATPSTPKHSVVPLAGILKTRNSSQNPFDQGCNVVSSPNRSSTPTNVSISTYGVRTSSIQGLQRRSSEHAQVKRRASNSSSSKLTLETFASPSPGLSLEPPLLSPTPQQRRSNVTGRVDAGALALAAHQQQQQQSRRSSKSRSSKDGIEVDYFGLRKSSIENIAPTTPPPLPYEPQAQGIQPIELHMSPTMTGFLMADPYPSVGSRYLDDESGQENSLAELSTDSQSDRRGSTGGSKKYKAPPPPIPIEAANAKSTERRTSSVPATPSTPTTPPGVRPARSVDTVMDQQFIEMANQMYHDHVVPVHLTLNTTSVAPLSVILASAAAPEQSVTPAETSVMPSSPTLLQPQQNLSSIMQQEHTESPLQHVMTPPAKSPYRVRESFESRISQGGSSASGPNFQGQGPVTPPSPASTVSPTIASTTTLPRPLTPAWYETKTNFASTNDVLTHYNAVMRGGSHHKREQQHEQQRAQQQQQQQQQPVESAQKQLFYPESAIGPLDDVPQASHMFSQKTNHDHIQPRAYSQQPRMGSADSFGVIRRRSSTGRGDTTQSIVNQQKLSLDERRHNESPQRPQQAPQLGRHSFVMPSETISTYSAWTGDLSDVTTTSGEVSVGAFVDRKHTSSLLQSHQQQDRRRSDEKTSSLSSSLQSGIHHSSDEQEKDRDVRKSQASAYSMGSSFGVGSSSRQSAGAYSNYSSNSGYGSGSIIVSGPLPSAGQPLSNSASGSSPSGSSHSGVSQKHNNGAPKKRSSHNRTDSGSGHGSLTESTGNLGNSSRRITKGAPMAISGKMNSIRLSAFGPGEDDVEISEAGDTQTSQGASVSGREFYLDNSNQQTPQDLERQIQQEWMDRRAAVKKDSKNRLQQLHKQQQEIDEQKKLHDGQGQQHQRQHQHHQDRQQRYLQLQSESCQEDIASEEPYTLNSVYFKSTAEILQLGKVHSSDAPIYPAAEPEATTAYPYPRAESVGMSSSSPSGTATSQGLASSASSMATSAVAEASPPSPNVQLYSSSPSPSSRHYGSIALPTFSTSHGGGTHKQHDYDRDIAPESQSQHDRVAADVDSVHGEPDLLIQTSSSYAVHRQNQPQSQARRSPPPPPTLLHYDSIDSIATVRAHHCYQQSLPSSSSSPQPQRSIPSSPTSPASPTSMSQRQQYAQHRYQQSQQQFHHPQSDQQLHASLTVLGPSQYRIIPNDATSESSVGASGVRGSISPASRTMSPVERASSRMTNLTNPESEYQWESAELNHHRWEMLETPPRND
ncbi:hypothetical protein BGX27_001184 [Mortierella sp. AM989]|nr:hypothetical protein BGX27_001184 [Mortierella sp. AM989]